MSAKVYDGKGRWRNKTVAFRMSPEEDEQFEKYVALSGLTKQDYIIKRLQEKDIIVVANPRVYKALRNQLNSVLDELHRLESISAINDELLDIILFIAEIMNDLNGAADDGDGGEKK